MNKSSNKKCTQNMSESASKYTKMDQNEHVLKRPGMYIGDVHKSKIIAMILNDDLLFEQHELEYAPALIKLVDEILVNAVDASTEDDTVTFIKITVDIETCMITVHNNGKGIPVEKNADNIYIPELIFFHLLSSSNYDDTKERMAGGTNGIGSKATNIFSTWFQVRTNKYTQVSRNNLSIIDPPKTNCKQLNGVEISFIPDLAKFNTTKEEFQSVVSKLIQARVYDLTVTTKDNVKIYYNGKMLQIKSLSRYVSMYDTNAKPIIDEQSNQWKVAILPSTNHNAIGFVNSIACHQGTHINHVLNSIIDEIAKSKKIVGKNNVKACIKNHIQIFVISGIVNPSFDSQCKTKLVTPIKNFKFKYTPSEDMIKKLLKSDIVNMVSEDLSRNEEKSLKKSDGNANKTHIRVPKLRDADKAGTKDRDKCTLILTEGDSAMSLILAGISVVGFKYYGCFPLKGKLMNPQTSTISAYANNTEINNIKKILGLVEKKKYTAEDIKNSLRYSKVMCAVDADVDGAHICGLIANLFNQFPGLLQIPGFFSLFRTPVIISSQKKSGVKHNDMFYSIAQFESWAHTHDIGKYDIKYLKGLGTSTSAQGKEYFKNLDKNQVVFDIDSHELDLFFNGKRSDDRKVWLANNVRPIDNDSINITFKDFRNRQLYDFAIDANERAIPDLRDGLKPSIRKIIWTFLTKYGDKATKNEIKIAQAGSAVAEYSQYVHGENSLVESIFGLSQTFYSSGNNINLIDGVGQCGDALANGKNHASARYVFCKLSKMTRLLFKHVDDNILNYKVEEGMQVEPESYISVIPLCLINAPLGIGLGYSTFIPPHNPLDVINNIKRRLQGKDFIDMVPYYKGFNGQIVYRNNKQFDIHGIWKISDNELTISELPVDIAFNDYTEFLESLIDKGDVKNYKNNCTTDHANYVITLAKEIPYDQIAKKFKLVVSKSTTNMVLFIGKQIKHYNTINDILETFYNISFERYTKRKTYLIDNLDKQIVHMELERLLITLVLDSKVTVFRDGVSNSKAEVTKQMKIFNLEEHVDKLLSFPLSKFTKEQIDKLDKNIKSLQIELTTIKATTESTLWLNDLDELEKALN